MAEYVNRPENYQQRQEDREEHEIICSMCGRTDKVPFRPSRGTAVLCRTCYDVKRRRRTRNKEMLRKIVGRFEITCDRCGREAEVDYRRYSAPVKLCDQCHKELKGEDHQTRRPKRLQVMTTIICCRCGKRDYVDFVPEDPDKVLCKRCYRMEPEDPES